MASQMDDDRSPNSEDFFRVIDEGVDAARETVESIVVDEAAELKELANNVEHAMANAEVEPFEKLAGQSKVQEIVIVPDFSGVAELPPGISVSNAYIELDENGDLLIIAKGYIVRIDIPSSGIIPTISAEGVIFPLEVFVALLEDNGIDVAAGPDGRPVIAGSNQPAIKSSGGNFVAPPGIIGEAPDVIYLPPYQELRFDQPEDEFFVAVIVEELPDSQAFSVVVTDVPPAPEVAINLDELCILEDGSNSFLVTASVPTATDDQLTAISFTGLPTSGVTVTAVVDNVSLGTVSLINGVYMPPSGAQTVVLTVTIDAGVIDEDSDVDLGNIQVTASATDGDGTNPVTSSADDIDVYVDAVLDDAVDLGDTPASNTANESTSSQNVSLGLTADAINPYTGSGDGGVDDDGTESITATITLNAALPAGGSLVFAAGYGGTATIGGGGTIYTITGFADAADLAAAIEALEVVVPANFDGTISGAVSVNAEDDPTDMECDPTSQGDGTANNTYSDSQAFALYVAPVTFLLADEDDIPLIGNNDNQIGDDDQFNLAGSLDFDFGVGGTNTISFAGISGTTDASLTSDGKAVKYFWDSSSGILYAYTGNDYTDPNSWVFTLTLDASLNYTFELRAGVDHTNIAGVTYSEDPNVFFALKYTITNSNGPSVVGVINGEIDDDAPVRIYPAHGVVTNGGDGVDETPDGVFDLDTDKQVDDNYGADGGTVRFPSGLTGQNSGLTSGGKSITWVVLSPTLLVAVTDYDDGGTPVDVTDDTGTTIFTVLLDPVAATYIVSMLGKVDAMVQIKFAEDGYDFVGGNEAWAAFVPESNTIANGNITNVENDPGNGSAYWNDNSQDLLLTPWYDQDGDPTDLTFGTPVPGSTINSSNIAGGIATGNAMGPTGGGEVFRIDFVQDVRQNPASGTYNENPPAYPNQNHQFDGHYVVPNASAVFTSTDSDGAAVLITAYDVPDQGDNPAKPGIEDDIETDVRAGETKDPITEVVIRYDEFQSGVIDTNGWYQVSDRWYYVEFQPDGSLLVAGIYGTSGAQAVGTEIAIFTDNGFSAVDFGWRDYIYIGDDAPEGAATSYDSTFKIGNFGAAIPSTDPVSFEIPIEVVDGDGDYVDALIAMTLTSEGEVIQDNSDDLFGDPHSYFASLSEPHVIGSDFADLINGDSQDNILTGGLGNDTINGGEGDDWLIGGAGDNILTGGLDADVFVIEQSELFEGDALADMIVDYNFSDGDAIDLTDLFDAPAIGSDLEALGYVLYNSATGALSVDADGSLGTAYNPDVVAELPAGLANEQIRILYDDGNNHTSTDLV